MRANNMSQPCPSIVARLALLCFSLAVVSGCASTTHRTAVNGAEVHTLREAYNNVHVVVTPAGTLLVDGGFEKSGPVLVERLRGLGIDPQSLTAIVVTHGHADHAGGAHYFREQFGTPIVAGEGDQPMMARGKNAHVCPTGIVGDNVLEGALKERYTPYAADVWITERSDLQPIAKVAGTIVPMPGHTDGSIIVVVGDAAFVGDLFRGAMVGSGAETHFFMCNLPANKRDIARLLETFPNVKVYFTGHFGPVTRRQLEEYLAPRP